MAKDPVSQQEPSEETLTTEIGLVHVMPRAYQGGKIPEGSRLQQPTAPAKHDVTPPPIKKPVAEVAPVVKRPPQKPILPKENPHKKRVLLVVAGVVFLVLLVVLGVVMLTRDTTPTPATPVVTIPEPVPVVTIPEPPPVVISEPDPLPEPFIKEPTPGRDTDSDGLSDVEEALYGSNPRLPDTDRDGFLDGNEVFHQYDPTLVGGATLLDRGVVSRYDEMISFLYPSRWTFETVSEEIPVNGIEIPTGGVVTFAVQAFNGEQTREALEAYLDEFFEVNLADVQYSTSKAGYPLATEKDQARAMLIVGDKLVTMRYTLGKKTTIDFLQTFQMMVNSIDISTTSEAL